MPGIGTLQDAIEFHRTGQWDEAESIYSHILRRHPLHSEALFFLGTLLLEKNQPEKAIESLLKANKLLPDHAAAQHHLALALHQVGRLPDAIAAYSHAVRLSPRSAQIHYSHGNALRDARETEAAATAFRQAIELVPDLAEAWHQLGDLARESGDYAEAERCYLEGIRRCPPFTPSRNNLAAMLKNLGRPAEALEHFQQAVLLAPNTVQPRANLAVCLAELGKFEEAWREWECASSIDPHHPLVLESRARLHAARGQIKEALACLGSMLVALPDVLEAQLLAGQFHLLLDEPENAARAFEHVVSRLPEHLIARAGLATALEKCDDVQAAAEYFCSIGSDRDRALWNLRAACAIPTILQCEDEIDERRIALSRAVEACRGADLVASADDLARIGYMPPFNLQFHGRNDNPIRSAMGDLCHGLLRREPAFEPTERARDSRPRVGFIVIRNERAWLKSIGGLIARLDRERLRPIVIAPTSSRLALEPFLNDWKLDSHWLAGSASAMIARIRELSLDLAYFFEVGTTALGYLVAASRVAPVQCASWGVQVTSGLSSIDHYLSTSLAEPPDAPAHYRENTVLLSTPLSWQERWVAPVLATKNTFHHLGSGRIYLCPQQLGKFVPSFDEVLARILRSDDDGYIVVTTGPIEALALRLRERWTRSIPDVANRIHFIPSQTGVDYWRMIQSAHVLLDPITFGGVNTTFDAFAAGKVVVTMPGPYQRSRYTAGCYRWMRMEEPIAHSVDDYIEKAVRIAKDDDYRHDLEEDVRERRESLMECDQSVAELENALVHLAEGRACR